MSKNFESTNRSIPDSLTEICLSAFSMAGGSHAALHCANWGAAGDSNFSESDFEFMTERYEFAVEPIDRVVPVAELAPLDVTLEEIATENSNAGTMAPSHHPISDFSLEQDGLAGHDFYLS